MKHSLVVAAGTFLLLSTITGRTAFIFDADVQFMPETEKAVTRAQNWLASAQQANGSWGNCNGANALAIMALMVNGTTPGHNRYGSKVAAGLDFIINAQHTNGYLVVGDNGNMYQHALATLCLSEGYGMTHNVAIREALIKAVDIIVKSQSDKGGWRYNPTPLQGQDLSVTVMQIMALRAAVETGVYVPKDTIDNAIKFVKECWSENDQGFGYTGRGKGNLNRAGAGTVSLQSCNLTDDPIIPKAIQFISKNAFGEINENNRDFWYGQYYGSVALYHYGGEAWKQYYPKICERVVKSWEKNGHYNDVLNTSWAILVLGVPYRYLPIYQR